MNFIFIISIFLIFQGYIESVLPIFSNFDEVVVIVLFLITLIKVIKNKGKIKLSKCELISLFVFIFYFLYSIVSNFKYRILPYESKFILSGILSLKFFFVYIFTRISLNNIKINFKFLRYIYIINNILLTTYFIVIILNFSLKFLKSWGIRYGFIKTVSAGFLHPAELDFMAIALMITQLFLIIILNKSMKYYKIICFESFIIVLAAGRTKGLTFYIIYVSLILLSKYIKKINIKQVILLSPIIIWIAEDRIKSEILNDGSVRGLLYSTSFKIADDFFPLGSGFGTFGSNMSRVIYSPLYYIYNLSNSYGLSPAWPAYITDSHWASVIAESGWIGFSIYLIGIIILSTYFFKFSKNSLLRLAISGVWFYGIFSSISDTILMSYRGVAVGVITAIFISIINSLTNNNIEGKGIYAKYKS